jgi:predicted phosphodiesterase
MDSITKRQIKIISDIHLEQYSDFTFEQIIEPGSSNILCLLGDIGNPFEDLYSIFIEWCSKNFYKVFIIAGNHEYYYSSIEKTNIKITDISSKFVNTYFLNNSSFIINNTIFIGTTLWSYIPEEYKDTIHTHINDYKYIENFTYDTSNKLHTESINYLKSVINRYKKEYKILILSHHSPLLHNTSEKHLEKLDTNYAFSSDQSSLMKDVDCWIYGHTHFNNKNNTFYLGKTAIVSNQLGYYNNFAINYNKKFYIELY